MHVREQLCGVSSLLPPLCGLQGSDSGGQASVASILPAEPSCRGPYPSFNNWNTSLSQGPSVFCFCRGKIDIWEACVQPSCSACCPLLQLVPEVTSKSRLLWGSCGEIFGAQVAYQELMPMKGKQGKARHLMVPEILSANLGVRCGVMLTARGDIPLTCTLCLQSRLTWTGGFFREGGSG